MTTQTVRSIAVPRAAAASNGTFPDLAMHRVRRRALDALRALEAVGEPCECRLIMADGTAVPSEQITDHELADIRRDLEHLSKRTPIALDALLRTLYDASSYSDRSRIPPALDRLLAYVAYWNATSPERVAALYDRLEPSRIVRAVGQTLLAATRLSGDRSHARQEFLSRFLADLRTRGTPEAVIERLQKGLQT